MVRLLLVVQLSNTNYINNSKITGTISGDIGDGEVAT